MLHLVTSCRTHRQAFLPLLILLMLLVACTTTEERDASAPSPSAAVGSLTVEEDDYLSAAVPTSTRSDDPLTVSVDGASFAIEHGPFTMSFGEGAVSDAVLVRHSTQPTALALRPLGTEANLLAAVTSVNVRDGEGGRKEVALSGATDWAQFAMTLYLYPQQPGLLRYRVVVSPTNSEAPSALALEWDAVDPSTGEEAPTNFTPYAERSPFAAPMLYGYSETMDATLLLWQDLTRLNPFMTATRYSPASTVGRRGRSLGHTISRTDLQRLPTDEAVVLYDGYLYLAEGEPADETVMFTRYLQNVKDIYELIAKPATEPADWQTLAEATLRDLDDPDTWVELEGKRYWRAYVSDSRQSAEAITQLDVGLGAARYAAATGDEQAQAIAALAERTLADFYNPQFGLVQNSGPLSITGNQGRGDTWYELGHVLKLAEWGLLDSEAARDLALRSADAWIDYAHTVDYHFHRFYNFPNPDNPEAAWQGTEREPDAAGGYAYYMLLLHDLTGESRYVEEAKAAVEALAGYGFGLAYETHITAQAAAACARLWEMTGDAHYLDLAYGPVANLVRLSWLWEPEYGTSGEVTTFWGLGPTQQSGVITPKEQYEAWIYLDEYLRLAGDEIDPAAATLVNEFLSYTLEVMAYSLPPRLPEGIAQPNATAYETVPTNRLDLYIPLEDMRDGWGKWGTIGQEVYGAGMAPTMGALLVAE
ncbi:MAG: hypothetical protein KDD73_10095 [Anaerolineales bacterium]|nr:hypothetical protein [Anaerolineales bacterium]MCB9128899.1 hypothetical protein [Ardenticatenales bacterium]